MREKERKQEARPENTLWASSIYGVHTQRGLVEIHIEMNGKNAGFQVEPDNAREIALNILGAAEAAEQEECLVHFMQDVVGAGMEQVAPMLAEFRRHRMRKEAGGETDEKEEGSDGG